MKKLFLILMLAIVAMAGMAQSIGDAFYIYRNDGQFNAFFRAEVDSIVYSNYDADSVYYDEIVTQLVYTADSIYRIPLAAIDSVGFVQPEVILQPNVDLMDEKGMTSYLKSVNNMSLTFDGTMPQDIYPQEGDILVSTDYDNPLFNDGFIGKVIALKASSDGLLAECDSVYDITEIYKQLTSIEKIVDTDIPNAARRVSGEWISSRNPIDFNLGYSHSLSDGDVSLSGSVNGTYIATIAYNITKNDLYLNLRINHDWQYGAHLNFKSCKGFGTLLGKVNSLPAIRFPMPVPVFQFQISGAPFVKGEGNMELDFSLNSPVHSYRTDLTFHNGTFSGSNARQSVVGSNKPNFDATFSMNGSVQAGYMVDFWLGTIDAIGSYVRTGLDFYLGPKLTGNFTMSIGTTNPVNYYTLYKDSKLGLSLMTIDYEAFGEASFMGKKTPKGLFMNGTIQTPLYHEWYIMPEFSDLEIKKDEKTVSATISSTPTRDILFPLSLGIGLYDDKGKLIENSYQPTLYKHENEGYTINQKFSSLQREKEYDARPMIKILGGEVSAIPTEKFKFDKAISVHTVSAYTSQTSSAVVRGRVDDFVSGQDDGEVGFFYNKTGNPTIGNAQGALAGRLSSSTNGEFLYTISGLNDGTTYYYCAYLLQNGEYKYGEVLSFTTMKAPDPDPVAITGASYNVKTTTATISCTYENVPGGAECGYYLQSQGSGRTFNSVGNLDGSKTINLSNLKPSTTYYYTAAIKYNKIEYTGVERSFMTKKEEGLTSCPNSNHPHWIDLGLPSGTLWRCCNEGASTPEAYGGYYQFGQVSSAPTLEQIKELGINCTYQWTTQNGINGGKFTGPNGGSIFLPAAGDYFWGGELYYVGSYGDYWSSTPRGEYSAYELHFSSGDAYSSYGWGDRLDGRSVRPVRK